MSDDKNIMQKWEYSRVDNSNWYQSEARSLKDSEVFEDYLILPQKNNLIDRYTKLGWEIFSINSNHIYFKRAINI